MSRSGTQSGLSKIAGHASQSQQYTRRAASSEETSERPHRRGQIERIASLRRYPRSLPSATISQAVLDFSLIGGAQLAVLTLIYERIGLTDSIQAISVITASTLASVVFLYGTGCYRRDAILRRSSSLSRIPTALTIAGLLLLLVFHYGFPLIFTSTRFFLSISRCMTAILVGMSIAMGATMLSRVIIRISIHNNLFRRTVLVIGNGQRARHVEGMNRAQGRLQELHFVNEELLIGAAAPKEDETPGSSVGELAERLGVDEIVLALDSKNSAALDSLLACKARGIPVTEFNSFVERQSGRVEMDWLEMSWLIHSPGFQSRLLDDVIKRLMDIVVSLVALVISLPVLLIAMLAIKLDSPGPVFYRQDRVTRGGRVFSLYKLRSMRTDAEQHGAKWADQNDSRVTRVGALLRKTRVDEIPQLLNILKGDMAIVGPRPERPFFVEELSQRLRLYDLRHTVRAGLTGWAQINYHYGASFEDSQRKLEYDLYYIKNFSLLRDVGIMLQTLRVIIWPDGVR